MPTSPKNKESILEFFKKQKLITVQTLIQFSGCSSRTIERHLKFWRTHSSYNYNGCYYVLPETPRFDSHGLWKVKDILFSKHGNLKQSIVHLVEHSEAGLSAKELSELLEVSVKEYLSIYFKTPSQLNRERKGGHYIYFSRDPDVYMNQMQKREEFTQSRTREQLSFNADAIIILSERIKHPSDTLDQLTRRVRRHGAVVSNDQVRSLLYYHGLLKKKVIPLFKP